MKALCWEGKHEVKLRNVHEPKILRPDDVVIKVTSAAISGSDLHLYNGHVPGMKNGDILGQENMGEIVAVGSQITKLKMGDRIVVAADIGCGRCFHCEHEEYSACDNSNPNRYLADEYYGYGGAGRYGYSHLHGGYAGGQAEFLRVPYAETNSIVIPPGIDDEKVLFLSDILPTGWMAAENANINPGSTVAVWGAGPVGQMVIRSAFLQGARRVISIDPVKARRRLSIDAGADVIDEHDIKGVLDEINYLTGGLGADACIDAVGLEARGPNANSIIDRTKAVVGLASDRPDVLRQAIMGCRKAGTISVPGVYAGTVDKLPFGAVFGKGLKINLGQTNTQKYMVPLLRMVLEGRIDPSVVISHRIEIAEGPKAYQKLNDNKEIYHKIVIKMN